MNLAQLTYDLVSIPSVTKQEAKICDYVEKWVRTTLPGVACSRHGNSLIVYPPQTGDKPVIGLFGHLDTVPQSDTQPVEIRDGKIYGCGASDMKGGLALMMAALERYESHACDLVAVFYDREEGPYEDNGLRELMDGMPPMDFALVLEPTNNVICGGCMGGMHVKVTFAGKRAHSARPWQGQNAIYRALPFLTKLRDRPRREQTVEGLTFYEVMTATMAHTANTGNLVPDKFEVNVNIRFCPENTDKAALADLANFVGDSATMEVTDVCASGKVCITDPIIQDWIDTCSLKVEPKQAWTDLARLTSEGIHCVNFGPGNPARAHQALEWIDESALNEGMRLLNIFLDQVCARYTPPRLEGQL